MTKDNVEPVETPPADDPSEWITVFHTRQAYCDFVAALAAEFESRKK